MTENIFLLMFFLHCIISFDIVSFNLVHNVIVFLQYLWECTSGMQNG